MATNGRNGGKKTGGKKKGHVNKITQDAREVFKATLEGQVPNIEKAFNNVLLGYGTGKERKKGDPAKYLELFAKYAHFFIPKQIDLKSDGKPIVPPVIQVLPPSK